MFLILAVCLMAHSVYSQKQPNLSTYNLRKSVKKVQSITTYDGAHDMNYQEDYFFDTLGDLITYKKHGFGRTQIINYPIEATTDSLTKTKYDHDGDAVQRITKTTDGVPKKSTHYTYNAPHDMSMTIAYEYSEDGIIESRTLTHYNNINQIESVYKYTPDEVILLEEHYTYDRYGNLIKKIQIFYDDVAETQTKTIEQRKYKYDRYGNWCYQQYSLNGVKRFTTTRTFEYYSTK